MSRKKFEYVSSTPSGTQHLPTMGRYGQIFFLIFFFATPPPYGYETQSKD